MIALLAGVVVVAVLVGWALHREFARLERERKTREAAARLAASAPFRDIAAAYARMGEVVRIRLAPAFEQIAETTARIAPKFEELGRQLRDAEIRRANEYRKGGQ